MGSYVLENEKSEESMYGYPRLLQALLGIAVIITPLIFVWTMELAVTTSEIADVELTFYVWIIPTLAAYHSTMYALFAASWIGGGWIIYDAGRQANRTTSDV